MVGPAFELVCGWADREIPLRVVFGGIDRTFERYYARAGRRRPLRIEFCEADVLELFDEWRRAVGVTEVDESAPERGAGPGGSRPTLVEHVTRVVGRLEQWLDSGLAPEVEVTVHRLIGELDAVIESAKTARGASRRQLVDQLADCDRQLVRAVRETVASTLDAELRDEAARDLEPYRGRMPPDRFREALAAATQQLLIDRLELPRIRFE